jgi:hypothetical protein
MRVTFMKLMQANPPTIPPPAPRWRLLLIVAVLGCGGVAALLHSQTTTEKRQPAAGLAPLLEEEAAPELALLMGDLQRLTHKMALSAHEGNAPLAGFYLHESLEQLKAIQAEAPEYERLPIALLIDRLALPAYEPFKAVLTEQPLNRDRLMNTLDGIIQSCNACHVATEHGFIHITRGTEVNPFNQSFKP